METAEISLQTVQINPEVTALSDETHIDLTWTNPHDIRGAAWKIFYIVDTVRRRQTIDLLNITDCNYASGTNTLSITLPGINVDSLGLSKSQVMTTGLLVFALSQSSEELLAINMVTQVSLRGDELFKTVFSPLEE